MPFLLFVVRTVHSMSTLRVTCFRGIQAYGILHVTNIYFASKSTEQADIRAVALLKSESRPRAGSSRNDRFRLGQLQCKSQDPGFRAQAPATPHGVRPGFVQDSPTSASAAKGRSGKEASSPARRVGLPSELLLCKSPSQWVHSIRPPSITTMSQTPEASNASRPSASSAELQAVDAGAGRRTKVGTACRNCRERKTRCDGRQPVCIACERRQVGGTCSYEKSLLPARQ